jgi:hypothetical protein
LDQWYNSSARRYDAFFLQTLPANLTGGGIELRYSVLANQTAIHALPAAISQVVSCGGGGCFARCFGSCVAAPGCQIHGSSTCSPTPTPTPWQAHSALLRWLVSDAGAGIHLTAHPLPALSGERDVRLTEQAGERHFRVCWMYFCLFCVLPD